MTDSTTKRAATFHLFCEFLSVSLADELTAFDRWHDPQQRDFIDLFVQPGNRLEALRIYADWLDDRDDGLGPAIRAELNP